jgi:hypothetical protein
MGPFSDNAAGRANGVSRGRRSRGVRGGIGPGFSARVRGQEAGDRGGNNTEIIGGFLILKVMEWDMVPGLK